MSCFPQYGATTEGLLLSNNDINWHSIEHQQITFFGLIYVLIKKQSFYKIWKSAYICKAVSRSGVYCNVVNAVSHDGIFTITSWQVLSIQVGVPTRCLAQLCYVWMQRYLEYLSLSFLFPSPCSWIRCSPLPLPIFAFQYPLSTCFGRFLIEFWYFFFGGLSIHRL